MWHVRFISIDCDGVPWLRPLFHPSLLLTLGDDCMDTILCTLNMFKLRMLRSTCRALKDAISEAVVRAHGLEFCTTSCFGNTSVDAQTGKRVEYGLSDTDVLREPQHAIHVGDGVLVAHSWHSRLAGHQNLRMLSSHAKSTPFDFDYNVSATHPNTLRKVENPLALAINERHSKVYIVTGKTVQVRDAECGCVLSGTSQLGDPTPLMARMDGHTRPLLESTVPNGFRVLRSLQGNFEAVATRDDMVIVLCGGHNLAMYRADSDSCVRLYDMKVECRAQDIALCRRSEQMLCVVVLQRSTESLVRIYDVSYALDAHVADDEAVRMIGQWSTGTLSSTPATPSPLGVIAPSVCADRHGIVYVAEGNSPPSLSAFTIEGKSIARLRVPLPGRVSVDSRQRVLLTEAHRISTFGQVHELTLRLRARADDR